LLVRFDADAGAIRVGLLTVREWNSGERESDQSSEPG
jgi:hypothetical protein